MALPENTEPLRPLRALIFKEWLKIRWVLWGALLISLGVLTLIALEQRQLFRNNKPFDVWFMVIFRRRLFYAELRFIPLAIGVISGLAQFVPEIIKKRLRLAFHLPVSETGLILTMQLIGLTASLLTSLGLLAGLALITHWYYPAEIVFSAVITLLPWLLAGWMGYSATVTVLIEPVWFRRIVLLAIYFGLIRFFFAGFSYGDYSLSWGWYVLLTLATTMPVFLSGHRFRRGFHT